LPLERITNRQFWDLAYLRACSGCVLFLVEIQDERLHE